MEHGDRDKQTDAWTSKGGGKTARPVTVLWKMAALRRDICHGLIFANANRGERGTWAHDSEPER